MTLHKGDKVYLRGKHIRTMQLRSAFGAWRVVRLGSRQAELEPFYLAELRHAKLRMADGAYSAKPTDLDPGRLIVSTSELWA